MNSFKTKRTASLIFCVLGYSAAASVATAQQAGQVAEPARAGETRHPTITRESKEAAVRDAVGTDTVSRETMAREAPPHETPERQSTTADQERSSTLPNQNRDSDATPGTATRAEVKESVVTDRAVPITPAITRESTANAAATNPTPSTTSSASGANETTLKTAPDSVTAEVNRMDVNRDGKISPTEHTAGARQMFATMDTNRDGKVTAAEMDSAQRTLPRGNVFPSLSSADKIKAVDTNGDGILTAQEHGAGSQDMFARMDTNRDSILTEDELRTGHARLLGGQNQ